MVKTFSQWFRLHKGKLTTELVASLFLSVSLFAQTTTTSIVGTWLNEEKETKIQIYQQAEKFFGKIVWLKEPNENSNPKTDILSDFVQVVGHLPYLTFFRHFNSHRLPW